jgi:hypothetical protein
MSNTPEVREAVGEAYDISFQEDETSRVEGLTPRKILITEQPLAGLPCPLCLSEGEEGSACVDGEPLDKRTPLANSSESIYCLELTDADAIGAETEVGEDKVWHSIVFPLGETWVRLIAEWDVSSSPDGRLTDSMKQELIRVANSMQLVA